MKKLNHIQSLIFILVVSLFINACNIEDIADPNNPDLTNIENNASLSEIQNLSDGILAGMRVDFGIYYDDVSVLGREIFRFSGSDPRYTGDLLGGATGVLDAGGFYTINPWSSRYRVIKNCNVMEKAVKNTKAAITADQKNALNGYLKTIKAHELLLNLNLQGKNGIRIDVADASKLGPFLDYNASLDGIITLLDEAKANLSAGGASFPIKLNAGFTGFDTPSSFLKFNRALAARVNAYRQNWAATITALNESFLDAKANLRSGVYYQYSRSGGDLLNEVFYPLGASGEVRLAHPSYVTDAESGDTRLSKVAKRNAATQNGLTSDYDLALYTSNADAIPVIRNEELILLWAEANIQTGANGPALDGINAVRTAAGLKAYSGANDKDSLIAEMLKQRRYSLYGECHRWVDLRRYGLLSSLPKDRTDDDVWENFPRPTNE